MYSCQMLVSLDINSKLYQYNPKETISQDLDFIIYRGLSYYKKKQSDGISNLLNNATVALKKTNFSENLSKSTVLKKLSKESLKNEIDIHQQLKHKNIVKFIDFKISEESSFIITKFCNKGNLNSYIKSSQFKNEDSVIFFFKQMLHGFNYLTSNNVCHCDVKPSNFLIHNNTVKIADFGMSISFNSLNDKFTGVRGSPLYMSPQMLNGESYSIKNDIWSLGVTLYYMLYEISPWGDINNEIKLMKFLNEKYKNGKQMVEFPENNRFIVSKEIKNLILRMLTYDEKKRIDWNDLFDYKFITREIQYFKASCDSINQEICKNNKNDERSILNRVRPSINLKHCL